MSNTGTYSPSSNELMAIRNALLGWSDVDGIGPEYFASKHVERALYKFLVSGTKVSSGVLKSLSKGRARINNFFYLINQGIRPAAPKQPDCYLDETTLFLEQLAEQAEIWRRGAFVNLDMSRSEQEIYFRVVARTAPVLFNMGFVDAIPHSAQVSRLTASMANHLGARHSELLQAAIVGWLHDPKLNPKIDLSNENLATHPINAAGLAWCVLHDKEVSKMLLDYFQGRKDRREDFVAGTVDALAINNDSRFVQMMVVLPTYIERVTAVFGPGPASQFKAVIEARLESAAKGRKPRALPHHLQGILSQIKLDSGLCGISKHMLSAAFAEAELESDDPAGVVEDILDGKLTISMDELARLKTAIIENAVLQVLVDSATLLHHHQEVMDSGRLAAEALVIADPMMLSPHKVASVYSNEVIERLKSYVVSFDDNNRLLPKGAQEKGLQWQRAVYLSMLSAADRLCGTTLLATFEREHTATTVVEDIDDLRLLIIAETTWCKYARASGKACENADVQLALSKLEEAYVEVVNQYRKTIYADGDERSLTKFYPCC